MEVVFKTIGMKRISGCGIVLAVLCSVLFLSTSDALTSSACYGVYPECDFYDLTCQVGQMIRLGELYAGRKTAEICNGPSHCSAKEECCSSATGDVLEEFTLRNVYDTYNNCSGKLACTSVQAPWQLLSTSRTSTFIEINYECQDAAAPLQFCSSGTRTGSNIELMFDGSRAVYDATMGEIDCRCRISRSFQQSIKMTVIDLRMHRSARNANQTQECSSATFRSDSLVQRCVDDLQNHHRSNFRKDLFAYLYVPPGLSADIVLERVYNQSSVDAPAMVWLAFEVSSGSFTMDCQPVPAGFVPTTTTSTTTSTTTTTTPSTTTTTTTPTTTTPTTTTTTTPTTTTTTTTPSTTTTTTTPTTTTTTPSPTTTTSTTTPTTTTTIGTSTYTPFNPTTTATTTPITTTPTPSTTTTTPTTTTTTATSTHTTFNPTTTATTTSPTPTTTTTTTESPTTASQTTSTTPQSSTSPTTRPTSTIPTSSSTTASTTTTQTTSTTRRTFPSTLATTPSTTAATTTTTTTAARPFGTADIVGDGVADVDQRRNVILAIAIPLIVTAILVVAFAIWVYNSKKRSYEPSKVSERDQAMQEVSARDHHVYFATMNDVNL